MMLGFMRGGEGKETEHDKGEKQAEDLDVGRSRQSFASCRRGYFNKFTVELRFPTACI